jgi:MFS family permease
MAEATHAKTGLPRNVRVLGLTSLLNDIASEAIYPLLPTFLLTVLPGSPVYLGLIEGLAESIASFLKLWAGGRSDQAGRRKGFVLFGYTLAAVVRPLVGLITAPWQLLLIRVSDRIGKGVRTAPRDALIADSTDPTMRGRAFGFHRAMDHLGAAIGPLLAAAFLWQWPDEMRVLFVLAGLPGIGAVVLLFAALRDAPSSGPSKEPVRLTLRPFDRNFRVYLLALLVFTLGNSSDLFLLAQAQRLGVPPWQLPLLWCAFHVLKSIANLLLGRAVDYVGPRPLLCLGWLVHAGVYLAFAVATDPWHAWLFFLSYALFYGLTEPSEKTLVTRLVGSERKGLAFGWYNAVIGIAALPASLVFGALYEGYGALPAFGVGAALALAAAGIILAVREPVSS